MTVGAAADGDGYVGVSPPWFGRRIFGGVLLGQAVHAVSWDGPVGRRIHSLHAVFLGEGASDRPVTYRVVRLHDGRSFSRRRVEVRQGEQVVMEAFCSLTADVPDDESESAVESAASPPNDDGPWIRPWVVSPVDVGAVPPPAAGPSRSLAWLRAIGPLPDDEDLHASIVAFFTDFTAAGGNPVEPGAPLRGLTSLDHAIWFHRPARADAWLLYDVRGSIRTGGRALLQGMVRNGHGALIASVVQELRFGYG